MIKKFAVLIIAFLLVSLSLGAQEHFLIGPAKTKATYTDNTRVFPCKWKNKKIRPKVATIDSEEIARMNRALETALQKYPAGILQKNLKRIYVFKSMRFSGLEYGGTYNRKTVYLTNNGVEMGYSDAYLEGTFHHEFSSILLTRHRQLFDDDAWLAAMPEDFKYGNGGKEALKTERSSIQLDSTLFAMGFLNQYSLASEEEDFNTYAHFLFLSDAGFWYAWENNQAIKNKTSIMIRFLSQLHPSFTLEYFQEM